MADTARICSNCNYPLTPLAASPEAPPGTPQAPQQPGVPQQPPPTPVVPQPTPQYGAQAYAAGPPNDGQATAALILGLLGVFVCPLILSIPAIILGRQSQRRIEMSMGALGGLGMAKAGWILGIVGTALGVIPVIIFFFFIVIGASGGFNGGF